MSPADVENVEPGIYRHYKGGLYRVLFMAKGSTNDVNNGIAQVVYVSVGEAMPPVRPRQICVRAASQFNEDVEMGDSKAPRFTRVGN